MKMGSYSFRGLSPKFRPNNVMGDKLPQLPLFITSEVAVPVNLEETYMRVCDGLKVFEA